MSSRLIDFLKDGRSPRWLSIHQLLDKLLFDVSTYGLAILLGIFSIIALFEWKVQNSTVPQTPLEVRYVEADRDLTLGEALDQMRGNEPVTHIDTRLSEAPFWFAFKSGHPGQSQPSVLEFPSRHASELSCWSASGVLLGSATRSAVTGAMSAAKAGFALRLDGAPRQDIICRARAIGPARLSVIDWPGNALQLPAQSFFHDSGLLEGGVMTLAAFMLITALVNRKAKYVLFSVWLVLGLRAAALSAGWDAQWLGHAIDPAWLPRLRLVTLTSYCMVTVTFFHTEFHEDLASIGSTAALR
ncbi:MAG: diguanylate cyclase, partial [Janthinobacterium lividum]